MPHRLLPGALCCLLASAALAAPGARAAAPSCQMPRVLGDGPHLAAREIREAGCAVAAIHRPRGNRSNQLIIVAQSVRPGAVVALGTRVRLTLGPRPPAPRNCRAPRFSTVLVSSREVIAWVNPLEEADNENSFGEGSREYVACTPPAGRKWEFFTSEVSLSADASLETLHAAGHLLAFTSSSADHYNSGNDTLTVLDIEHRHTTFRAEYHFEEDQPGYTTFGEFAIDEHGTLAWLRETALAGSSPIYTLELHDPAGNSTLETGPSVSDPTIADGVLSWVGAGGAGHSQPLPAGS